MSIFDYNINHAKNAYLSWRTHPHQDINNLHVLAEGYLYAAKELISTCLNDNSDKKADSLIYPILYTFDQAIELYSKAILLATHSFAGKTYTVPNNHDIRQLYNEMKSMIKVVKNDEKELNKYLQPLYNYINELYGFIQHHGGKPDIDFARYPIRVDGTEHFYITTQENIVVNLENLCTSVDEIGGILDGVILKYLDLLENTDNDEGNEL